MEVRRNPSGPFGQTVYYSKEEIDEICLEALTKTNSLPSEPGPIEIENVIERYFRCHVVYEDIAPDVLGFTVFGHDGKVQIIGTSESLFESGPAGERRARATLAHEMGHGLLHAVLFIEPLVSHTLLNGQVDSVKGGARRILCRKRDFEAGQRSRGYDGKWWEYQANRAIGALLLPKRLMLQAVESFLVPEGLLCQPTLPPAALETAARHCAEVFEVNPAATRIRLTEMFLANQEQRPL